jgi:hypothetical protein
MLVMIIMLVMMMMVIACDASRDSKEEFRLFTLVEISISLEALHYYGCVSSDSVEIPSGHFS